MVAYCHMVAQEIESFLLQVTHEGNSELQCLSRMLTQCMKMHLLTTRDEQQPTRKQNYDQ